MFKILLFYVLESVHNKLKEFVTINPTAEKRALFPPNSKNPNLINFIFLFFPISIPTVFYQLLIYCILN